MQLNATARTAIGTYKDSLANLITNKLKAYRVKNTTNCGLFTQDLWLQIDMTTTPSGLAVYTMTLDVYTFTPAFPDIVSIYNVGSLGSTTQIGLSLSNLIEGQVSNLIDVLAADYATANP